MVMVLQWYHNGRPFARKIVISQSKPLLEGRPIKNSGQFRWMPRAATALAIVRYFNRRRPAFSLKGFLAMADVDYLEILDWLARNTIAGKRGSTPAEAPAIFERPGIDGVACSKEVKDFGPDPLEGNSVCAFKLVSHFLDKREHSRTKPTQRQRASSTMICVPRSPCSFARIGITKARSPTRLFSAK
jgi:hypothetical protein